VNDGEGVRALQRDEDPLLNRLIRKPKLMRSLFGLMLLLKRLPDVLLLHRLELSYLGPMYVFFLIGEKMGDFDSY
jgi:hypothetical protein